MLDVVYLGVFILLALVLAIDSFNKWRRSKNVLYLIAIAVFIFAAISVFSSTLDTIYFLIGGMILRVVAQQSEKKKIDKKEEDKEDEVN